MIFRFREWERQDAKDLAYAISNKRVQNKQWKA